MWSRRWLISASVYTVGECLACSLVPRPVDITRVFTVAVSGATADSIFLRTFHRTVDARLPSPIVRTLSEQCMYAPLSNAAYLTITHPHWDVHDWWTLYSTDCMYWPVMSYIGYRYIEFNRRYLYVSMATVVWTTWRGSMF